MCRRIPLAPFIVLILAVPAGAQSPPAPAASKPGFAIGERLSYEARVWKGFRLFGLSVGTTTFEVKESKDPRFPGATLLRAKAEGGALGYSVTATAESFLDPATQLPLWADLRQEGSEVSHKQMRFEGGEAVYVKRKHCNRWRTCTNQDHFVSVERSRGLFRGTETVQEHCRNSDDCTEGKHYFWEERHRHTLDRPTYDLLSVIYVSRGLDLAVGGPAEAVRIVNDHDLWDVKIRATGRETVEVPGGTYQALKIEITPVPVSQGTTLREEFQGLFGIKGSIELWIDEKTRIPVKIRGVVPFGVDLNMEISLTGKELPKSSRS